MSGAESLVVLGWIATGVGYGAMLAYRKPLARWQVARSRLWRNRPHAQRIHEVGIILGTLVFAGISVFILYEVYVAQPRFRRRMEELTQLPIERPTAPQGTSPP